MNTKLKALIMAMNYTIRYYVFQYPDGKFLAKKQYGLKTTDIKKAEVISFLVFKNDPVRNLRYEAWWHGHIIRDIVLPRYHGGPLNNKINDPDGWGLALTKYGDKFKGYQLIQIIK